MSDTSMSDTPPRTVRTVRVSDPVWDTLSLMAREMGADRDSLVNQALFTFARLNGYVTPGRVIDAFDTSSRDEDTPDSAPSPLYGRESTSAEAHAEDVGITGDSLSVDNFPGENFSGDDFSGNAFAGPGFADDRFSERDFADANRDGEARGVANQDVADRDEAFAVQVGDASHDPNDLDRLIDDSAPPLAARAGDVREVEADAPHAPRLILYSDGSELERVNKDRFLIGRGKHCDLIIHSGKVSREHAAIVLDGDAFFIEDLGSSNGTWFDRKRITRRQVEDGDEYFICSEKITCRYA